MDLTGKTVLVTGAGGTGVGAGVCRAVSEAGGRLVVNDLSQADASRAAGEYGAVATFAADVSSEKQVEALFARVDEEVGGLDGLVNNAGVGLSRLAHEASAQEYDTLQAVDYRGPWLVAREFARRATARGSGAIVNISSVHAVATIRGYAIYAAAKAGVEGLTRGMAVELGPMGVRCNAVAPGYVHSEQNHALIRTWTDDPEGWVESHTVSQQALERQVEPLDCGWAVAFLLSDYSRSITGQVLRVDAGLTTLLYGKDFV